MVRYHSISRTEGVCNGYSAADALASCEHVQHVQCLVVVQVEQGCIVATFLEGCTDLELAFAGKIDDVFACFVPVGESVRAEDMLFSVILSRTNRCVEVTTYDDICVIRDLD